MSAEDADLFEVWQAVAEMMDELGVYVSGLVSLDIGECFVYSVGIAVGDLVAAQGVIVMLNIAVGFRGRIGNPNVVVFDISGVAGYSGMVVLVFIGVLEAV